MFGYFKWLIKHFRTLLSVSGQLVKRRSEIYQKLKAECRNKEFQAMIRILCALPAGVIGIIVLGIYTAGNAIVASIAAFFWFSYVLYSLELLDKAEDDP